MTATAASLLEDFGARRITFAELLNGLYALPPAELDQLLLPSPTPRTVKNDQPQSSDR